MYSGLIFKSGVSLKNYSTFHIGGKARYLTEVYNADQMAEALTKDNAMVLGKGSNVLISDDGYDGTVIINRMGEMCDIEEGVIVGAGVSLPQLSRFYLDLGLEGFEFACGIPASVGGAIVMNAGAFDNSVSDMLLYCEATDGKTVVRLSNEQCQFGYRKSALNNLTVIRACFSKSTGDRTEIRRKMDEYTKFRISTQPKGFCAGSIFKRADKPAGWYIEQAGLKGARIGGAEVSRIHANFIMNMGFASSDDVMDLIRLVKAEVYDKFNVCLEEEIRLVGEF